MYFINGKRRARRTLSGLEGREAVPAIPPRPLPIHGAPIAAPCATCKRGKFLAGLGVTTCEIREGGFRVCTDSDVPGTASTASSTGTTSTSSSDQRPTRTGRIPDATPSGYYVWPTPAGASSGSSSVILDALKKPLTGSNLSALIDQVPAWGWAAIGLGAVLFLRKNEGKRGR